MANGCGAPPASERLPNKRAVPGAQPLARGGQVSERTSLEPEEQGLGMPLLGGALLRL